MTIPRSQLETWSHQGATVTAQSTHESIRNALKNYEWPSGVKFDDYLQGSYRNTTNIRGDSDVDLVVELTSTFRSDLSALSTPEQRQFNADHCSATYTLSDFKSEVTNALREYYGSSAVEIGNKSIKISKGSNRLAADVVVCMSYRKYQQYQSTSDYKSVDGITFFTQTENRQIINFPKVHYANGAEKNSQTNRNYKPTVRMFKNARSYLIDQKSLASDVAPSYFIECLLYNVPSTKYVADPSETFYNVLAYLHNADLGSFLCQNGQMDLFGDSPEQWSQINASILRSAYINLWNNW